MKRASIKTCAQWLGLLSCLLPACAAPDAIPGAPGSAGPYQPSAGEGGDPVWGAMFGQKDNPSVQRGYDIAVDRTTHTAAITIGFDYVLEIPDVNGSPFTSLGSFDFAVAQISAATGKPVWAQRFGDPGEETRTVVDIDIKGNVIVAGGFTGTLDIGTGARTSAGWRDVFVAKLDASGAPLWLRTFGDASSQFATDVASDGEGNIIVVGFSEGGDYEFDTGITVKAASGNDIFVTKLSPSGATLWGERVGSAASGEPNDPTACVAVSRSDGSILVGGAYSNALVFPNGVQLPILGSQDGFVVKLDTYGAGVWGKSFGEKDQRQRVNAVSFGPSGEALFTGGFTGNVTLGGDTLMGYRNNQNLLIAKLDATGKHVFSHGYGSSGEQIGRSINVDSNGNILVVGEFEGVIDAFGDSAIVNADVDGRWDAFALKIGGKDGLPIWARGYGAEENQHVAGAALESNDEAIMIGTSEGAIPLGGMLGEITTSGGEDVFVLSVSR